MFGWRKSLTRKNQEKIEDEVIRDLYVLCYPVIVDFQTSLIS